MGNTARKIFTANGTFVVPGKVKRVRVIATDTALYKNRIKTGIVSLDGTTYMWGQGASGMLGDGTTVSKSSPVAVSGSHPFVAIYEQGSDTRWGIDSLGLLWGWGINSTPAAPIGDGTLTSRTTPVPVLGGRLVKMFSGQIASNTVGMIASDGNTYMWGANFGGQVGANISPVTTFHFSSPVLVAGGHNFVKLSAGNAVSCAIDTAGAAWAWGNGVSGTLGNNANIAVSTPVAVLGGHVFQDIVLHNGFIIALDTAGALWGWGTNGSGQLGDGTVVGKSTPIAIAAGTVFTQIAPTSPSGSASVLALDINGNVWSWGINTNGMLGQNLSPAVTAAVSSPVMISAGMGTIVAIKRQFSTVSVINSNGQMYMWGQNQKGMLGAGLDPAGGGAVVSTSSPVLVLGGINFAAMEFGYLQNVTACDRNGKIYCWGNNQDGQLGDGTTVAKSTPVAVLGVTPLNLIQPQKTIEIDVTPGQSYAVVISEYQTIFGTTQFGQLFNRVVVEYDQD